MVKQIPTVSVRETRKVSMRQHPSVLAEYASLAISAAGTVAIALSGQVLHATVGSALTVAMSLNMANRHRLHAQMQQSMANLEQKTVVVVVKLRQQLLAEIGGVSHQLQDLASRTTFSAKDFDLQLTRLQQLVASLQTNTEASITDLQEKVSQQPSNINIPEIQEMQTSVFQLQQTTEEIIKTVSKHTEKLGQWQDQGETEDGLTKQDELDQTINRILALEEAIATLEESTTELVQQNQEVIKPYLKKLGAIVKQLQAG